MRERGILLSAVACAALLLALTMMSAVGAGDRTPGHKSIGPQPGGAVPSQLPPPNDRCEEATELTASSTGTGDSKVYTATKHSGFYGAKNLDDWYKYTTHAACGTDYKKDLQIHLTCNRPQIEVEIFDGCDGWPLTSSMQTEDLNGNKTYQLSGLVKDLDITPLASHTYMIHVNYIRPPDSGGITYDLKVTEVCVGPPR